MRKILTVIILFVFFCLEGVVAQEVTYIKAGLLYDSEQNVLLKNKAIQVKGNRIVSIGEYNTIPSNSTVIDLSEYTVLPGLIDGHTHVLFSQDADKDFAAHSIQSLTMESDALRALRGSQKSQIIFRCWDNKRQRSWQFWVVS